MDRRNTQISLPLNLHEKQIKDHVKQHWNITFAQQGKISVVGKRIMAMVLAQIHENDMKLKPFYQMHVSDVVFHSDGGSAYQLCRKAFKELASAVWMIEDFKAKKFKPRNILDTTKDEEIDGFETAYNNGYITIALNKTLDPYFIQLAHYSKYELTHYMKFKSWYSMRLWEVLSAYRDTGEYFCPLDEFRRIMDCEKKYKDVNLMIRYTLSEPLEELSHTDLAFEYEKVFAKYHGKGRPPVVGLQFTLLKEKLTSDQTLAQWAEYSEEHHRILNELHHAWKISKPNLIKHLPALRMEGAKKLIRQWQIKEASGERILDREKYCNLAFSKQAKEEK